MNLTTKLLLPLLWLLCAAPLMAQSQSQTGDAPSYTALADLLENEQSREKLIGELRALADASAPAGTEAAEVATDPSATRQLAQTTRAIAEGIGDQFTGLASVLNDLAEGQVAGDNGQFSMSILLEATLNLSLVILATLLVFLVLRRLVGPLLFSRLDHWSLHGAGSTPVLRRMLCVALAAAMDVLIVGLAYVAGNLVATFLVGQTGEQTTQASLFLNAFMVIELLKAGLRMVFSRRYDGLRLLPLNATEASYWNRRMALLIGLLGYGVMVAEPLITIHISAALSQSLNTMLMLTAFIYAAVIILKNRRRLAEVIRTHAEQRRLTTSKLSLHLLARTWHLLALGYFAVVLVLVLLSPAKALPFVLFATLKTLGVIVVGILLSTLLGQTIGRRIHLSDDLRRKLPLLEARLNSYVPNALRFLRFLVLAGVILLSLNAWHIVDLATWSASEAGGVLMGRIIAVALILAVSATIWVILASLIEHKLNPETGTGMPSARTQTLLSLFRSALAVLLVTMTVMIALSELGINIGPLIAGAGVLGLAIGFGAQKLVQDVITGIFIQIENAMNTGDVVTLGGITGTAEKLSIRSVGIRDLSGTYHIIPFSSVDTVSNYMRDFAYHVGEYRVSYRENIDDAITHLQNAFDELVADPEQKPYVLEALEVAGVIALADSSVNIRVRIMTAPGMQWAVGRAYNRLVKMHFEQAGIEIPYPQSTVHFEGSRQHAAPAVQLAAEADGRDTGT
ncbi:mechanosensitive ion channel [Oceanimonas sp. CHS3-5]|uniref:mechanosensitive ion channel domain-containing protein n=1 Tax=Oceanimonas sp. CHS3-5 TaxID=3068186 RepID=UPI00273E44F3|nr:mechanosensitive ion channel domain-containing protein [Oceanimonas sp. CHS3-5]MDP5291248.1 mechanosensitive ion channel [Oceanimonas sp. CHS3-5]